MNESVMAWDRQSHVLSLGCPTQPTMRLIDDSMVPTPRRKYSLIYNILTLTVYNMFHMQKLDYSDQLVLSKNAPCASIFAHII
jgi:hypothetical protein